MATGGDVFLLDMGDPVKIMDLARRIIELSGLTVCDVGNPDGDIEIAITGLRPGEKLYEELLIADNPEQTQNKRIMKAHEEFIPLSEFTSRLDALKGYCQARDLHGIQSILLASVSGYVPDSHITDLE
jgi:FlaA1/EpsC-like NDP-sugar epimerase